MSQVRASSSPAPPLSNGSRVSSTGTPVRCAITCRRRRRRRRRCRVVVPVPPRVRRRLGVPLRGVLPLLLAPEGGDVEVAPGAPHGLVAAGVDEVRAEHAVVVADEGVGAVPLVHAEVGVEAVRQGVPGHRPAHPRLHPLDVGLRRPRGEHQRGVAGVEVREVGDLVGQHGAADAGVLGPAVHAGLEEGAVDDQLPATGEQVDQAPLSFGAVELVLRLDGLPRHAAALGGQRVTGAGQLLLLHEQSQARRLPVLGRHDRG